MKTLKTVISIIAFAIVAVSCQREDISVTTPADDAATIIATISNEATRATFSDNAGVGVSLTWEVNDKIMLYDADGNYAATFETSTGGGATAIFILSDGAPADGNYTAVYPAYEIAPGVPAPTLAHRAQVVNGLTQGGNNSTAHLDTQSYMSGTLAYSSGSFTSNAVTFDMDFALLTVEIDTPTGYVAATHGAPTSLTLYNGGKTTTLFLENITATDIRNGLTLYMVIEPYKNPIATPNEERTLYFELITENATFMKEKANVSKEYEAGKRYTAILTGADILGLTAGIYTLATLPNPPSGAPTTWVVTDAITDATNLSALKTAITNSGKKIRLILPAATSIGARAFERCTTLTSVSLPEATDIGNYAFYQCAHLFSVSLPKATSIGVGAFAYCASLTSVSLPVATSIEHSAFFECAAVTSTSLPVATSIGTQAFGYCALLTSVSLPAATSIGDFAFSHCALLTSISLPVATSIGDSAFFNCTVLSLLDIGGATAMTSVGISLFNGTTVVGNIHLTVGAGDVGNVNNAYTQWRGYGPFASITIKP